MERQRRPNNLHHHVSPRAAAMSENNRLRRQQKFDAAKIQALARRVFVIVKC